MPKATLPPEVAPEEFYRERMPTVTDEHALEEARLRSVVTSSLPPKRQSHDDLSLIKARLAPLDRVPLLTRRISELSEDPKTAYILSFIDGVLPLGLSLTESGVLSGTPTDALGTQRAFVVRCTDLAGNTDARAFVMTVIDSAPFSIVTQQVPDGQTGVAYLQLVYAADRLGAAVSLPVRWRVIDGALPPGLALEASMQDNAFLSGTPDRPGRYAFTIEATDAQGRIASHPYVVTIFTAGVTARADGTRIVKPGGEVRVDFTGTNLPAGAKWFLRSGQLPPGTTFSEAGVLTGTVPADAATRLHTFSVSVGLSAAEPLSEVWWTVEVNPVIPTKTGCTATGPELLVLGVLGLLARRRRVTR